MTVNIISDIRLTERWEPLLNELGRQGITDYKIWPIVEDKDSVIRSINLSHKQIIRDAKERELPEVYVMEDDIWIPAKDGWKRFIEDIPIWPFDIYLGGTYGLNKPITGKIDQINGFHCYIMRERFYDTFLNVPDDVHIDTALDGLGRFYVKYPFIALQRPGFSSNTRSFSDKNADLSSEDIYYG